MPDENLMQPPATKRIALTEDEQDLIERHRRKNAEVDAFNAGLSRAHSEFVQWETGLDEARRVHPEDKSDFAKHLARARRGRST